ncbi:hypothetical protein ASF10_23645 [Flavobacterium sp. Leaf82]|jgi:hypothetical protein|uniref:hypothetical protein n=1 Tax=Flavobacterium sp. Leaf82 TaxID=1736238 RepID=UPI0006FBDD75|nr:hypothetical protein [Flavobacterium sp. Leaf82]KQO25830.1 hypothetical protein ASF10_23645 [Flavobacterium sp. Leaf82]
MKIDKYQEESISLAKASDIAINMIKRFPPKGWDEKTISHVIANRLEIKKDVLNPEPQFRNLKSLKYNIEAVFTKFQEGHGILVEEFWKEIKAQNLPYKRENKMLKILKRKKINNIHEYDFVIDVMVPYEQEGLINHDEVILLNDLIAEFENKKKK